jgi:hypothetical protein
MTIPDWKAPLRNFALVLLLVLPAAVFATPASVCPVSHGEELLDDSVTANWASRLTRANFKATSN